MYTVNVALSKFVGVSKAVPSGYENAGSTMIQFKPNQTVLDVLDEAKRVALEARKAGQSASIFIRGGESDPPFTDSDVSALVAKGFNAEIVKNGAIRISVISGTTEKGW